MYYTDSFRTVTRRDSSLLTFRGSKDHDSLYSRNSAKTATPNTQIVESVRPWGSIRNEVITSLFSSMIFHVVETWDTALKISPSEPVEPEVIPSGVFPKKKEKKLKDSSHIARGISSNVELRNTHARPNDPLFRNWWSHPDELGFIQFTNGNIYEGHISKKLMHGEGRMQYADGTLFLGIFENGKMKKGVMQWRNSDWWYEGEFANNVRHGRGMLVNSRTGCYYVGDWDSGTKHGNGRIMFKLDNTYEGDWSHNIRTGFGVREYCKFSGYIGEWSLNQRIGNGMMIWPNHDMYKGEWDTGKMHGSGTYFWDVIFNNSMTLSPVQVYRGRWDHGLRHGHGKLDFGLGSKYEGNFRRNIKDGSGKFIANNGLTIAHDNLFHLDFFGLFKKNVENLQTPVICDLHESTSDLKLHVVDAIKNFDVENDIRLGIIIDYLINNKIYVNISLTDERNDVKEMTPSDLFNFMRFEEHCLRRTIRYYLLQLKQIYNDYARLCDNETTCVTDQPVLIRLYFWQFLYDINIQTKGYTLVEIDDLFFEKKAWQWDSPHNPFEVIYFWQFVHCLILTARRLYARREMPDVKPDSIVAPAFVEFLETDVFVNAHRFTGHLPNNSTKVYPLQKLYTLYRKIGEPHTVRDFLRAVHPVPDMVSVPREHIDFFYSFENDYEPSLLFGRNQYIYGDKLLYATEILERFKEDPSEHLPLFNINNVSVTAMIDFFSTLLPSVKIEDRVSCLDVKITFYEFYEVLVQCAQLSTLIGDEEMMSRNAMLEFEDFLSTSSPDSHPKVGHKKSLSSKSGKRYF